MLRLVLVNNGVRIYKPELAAELLDVLALSGQKQPARFHSMGSSILLEHLGRILLGFQGDRVHEDIASNVLPKSLLHLREVCGLTGAKTLAFRVHEVD